MERRVFLKNVGAASTFVVLSPKTFSQFLLNKENLPKLLSDLSLTDFGRDQEENPSVVSNMQGDAWLFSLRRLSYPAETEIISCFYFGGKEWEEQSPVTPVEGFFESPCSACAVGGKPVVAWIGIGEDQHWDVYASTYELKGFRPPEKVSNNPGKASNPRIIAIEDGTNWLAWESYYNGKFSIYLSKYQDGIWGKPTQVTLPEDCCFDPAIVQGKDGQVYMVYGITDGIHQNIRMNIIDANSLAVIKTVPVFIGGSWKNRVNLNTKPSLAFDKSNRLWISWESNKDVQRLEDSDCYTGDRVCGMVCYIDGEIVEQLPAGTWLFKGENDHLPTFFKDPDYNLYLITRCGGDFKAQPNWKFRLSWLDDVRGWKEPVTILETKQKGQTEIPAVVFSDANSFWLSWRFEIFRKITDGIIKETKLNLTCFSKPSGMNSETTHMNLAKSENELFHLNRDYRPLVSGRQREPEEKVSYKGKEYIVLFGDLHEHSEGSICWPAGTDGTLHDDYRFALYSEGLDFMGFSDHADKIGEQYWRRNLRLADFYNDEKHFLAMPVVEWTLFPAPGYTEIPSGVGHRNIVFSSTDEAKKFIRNKSQLFSEQSPEANDSPKLWQLIREKNIDCVAIPHHIHDQVHPIDWQVRDEEIEPVIELFQIRGSSEYPGCPRANNVSRHSVCENPKVYADYALREKGYKIGFIASGDHNGIGVGAAVLLVKEKTRKGLLEAIRARRCYATTGDKIFLNFKVNNFMMGESIPRNSAPEISISVKGTDSIKTVEILRNSYVIKTFHVSSAKARFSVNYTDTDASKESKVLYYYARVTQENGHIAWSSPVWLG
jgi:hypothetical protein